jgi:hypothetical protein
MADTTVAGGRGMACPDCGGGTAPIKLIDAGAMSGLEYQTRELQYAAGDAEVSAWTGRFPIAGMVRGRMCQDCGRIALYGLPAREL